MIKKLITCFIIVTIIVCCRGNTTRDEGRIIKRNSKLGSSDILASKIEQSIDQNSHKINQKDEKGRKVGLWKENNGLIEAYYFQGKRHGIFRAYNRKNNDLSVFGMFDHGVKSGNWYYFDEDGFLILNERDITFNNDDGPSFSSLAKFYYKNGIVKEEGKLMYEDVEVDYVKLGIWNYYDQTGKLLRSE